MSLRFKINGEAYHVDLFDDGYAWVSLTDEGKQAFATAQEAQQDAIEHARKQVEAEEQEQADRLEDEVFGSYEEQVNRCWKLQRGI